MTKLDLLARVQPHPSRLELVTAAASSGHSGAMTPHQYLFTPGNWATTECETKERFPHPLYLNVEALMDKEAYLGI